MRSIAFGAFMGSANSIMVNCALIEISLSPFFALAFGILFLISGAAVGFQAAHEPDGGQANRTILTCFALLTTSSGVVAFLLERDWSHGLTPRGKVPLYGLLGVSLAFSINFSAFELVGKLQQCVCDSTTPLVRNEWQVRAACHPHRSPTRLAHTNHPAAATLRLTIRPGARHTSHRPSSVIPLRQVRLIALSSILTGLFFGLTFGVMDLEDQLVRTMSRG